MSSITTGRSIDNRNRFWFTVLGLLLLAAGILGLLVQSEILDADTPGQYYGRVRDLANDYPGATIAILIALGLLLFLVGISWIRRQIATPATRLREVTISDDADGSTTVDADVLSEALARDIERIPDVHDATARVVGAGERPKLAVRATVDGLADIGEVRGAMEDAYARFGESVGSDGVEANLHLKQVPTRRSRVT
jgi:hypothetical protein